MAAMRAMLKELNPDLYQDLLRSHQIAHEQWLPSVPPQNDSTNSYPHIRNLETYLDSIFLSVQEKGSSIHFNALEIYIILSAILLHDIGKSRGSQHHGSITQEMIHNSYGELGISSREVAMAIEEICLCHDMRGEELEHQLSKLAPRSIDPYGKVRLKELACLLILLDHMDASFRRITPHYIKPEKNLTPPARHRQLIKNVNYNPTTELISTVLGDLESENSGERSYRLWVDMNNYITLVKRASDCGLKVEEINREAQKDKMVVKITGVDFYEKYPDEYLRERQEANCYKQIFDDNPQLLKGVRARLKEHFRKGSILFEVGRFSPEEWAIARGLVWACRLEEEEYDLPKKIIIAQILADLLESQNILQLIRDELTRLGIKIRSWLLEWNGMLFNEFGEVTYEPILSKKYLQDTIKNMWKLKTQIFGMHEYSYDNLASILREANLDKIKVAVARIAKIFCNEKEYIFIMSDDFWRWQINSEAVDYKTELSNSLTRKDKLITTIEKLGSPFIGGIYYE